MQYWTIAYRNKDEFSFEKHSFPVSNKRLYLFETEKDCIDYILAYEDINNFIPKRIEVTETDDVL